MLSIVIKRNEQYANNDGDINRDMGTQRKDLKYVINKNVITEMKNA